MRTIEIEKTSGNQVRLKWSNSTTSMFIANGTNVRLLSNDFSVGGKNITITFSNVMAPISFDLSEITTINGAAPPETVEETLALLTNEVFPKGGGSGGGAVDSVTGNLVTGTSSNPVVSLTGTPSDIVTFDDDGNPEVKPIGITQLTDIGSFPPFANGVFAATAMNAVDKTGLLLFIEFSTTTPKAGTFPTYNTGGTLPVANGVANGDAVNLGQLNLKANIASTQTSSAALTFTSDSVSGTIAAPITGNITGNVTGAILGVTVLVIHNSGSAPTFDSKFKKLSGSGDYIISEVNYIYCQYIDATTILYSINQAV